MLRCRRVGAAMLFVALCAGAWGAEPLRFVQDRFVISFWVDPPADAKMPARYREIADANFTMVLGGFGGSNVETIQRQLKLCKKNGLKAIVTWPADLPAERLPDGPACWGYGLRDEPNVADFPGLRARADAIRNAKPGKLAYVNLFPDYANAQQLGVKDYDEYVSKYIEEMKPDVICMDYYPMMKPGIDGRDGYCVNLEVMRRHALANGIPFWNFFNCMPYGPQADPTESQLRWQVFTSIAYGAKGVLYFCYYTPGGGEFPKGGALIAQDDQRTRHYDEARRINGVLKNLGPTLMQLTSSGIVRITPEDDAAAVTKKLAGTPIKNITRMDVDPTNDYLIGTFKHADGRRAVLLNNYRHDYAAWPTLEFDVPPDKVRHVSGTTGKEEPVRDASPGMPGVQIPLDSGEGALFLLP
jgi:hypothetical protein